MNNEARTVLKVKATRQKIPAKSPHSGQIGRKVSEVSQAQAPVKKVVPSQLSLSEIMSIRRIGIQGYRHGLSIGVPIPKLKLIKPAPVLKLNKRLLKLEQPLRIQPREYKHLPKIEPQTAGSKLKPKILPKVYIQQHELTEPSRLRKVTSVKTAVSRVEFTPLPKVGGRSMPSPSLLKNRRLLSLKRLREPEEELQPITEEIAQGGGTGAGVTVDFFDLFLDCVRGEGGAKGAFESAGPTILILTRTENDDFARAIQNICRETYRQRANLGKPDTPVIGKGDWRKLEQLDPKHSVSLIEIDNPNALPSNFLEEFARADKPGFLIFYVDQAKSEEFYDSIWSQLYPQRIRLYLLSLKKLSLETKKRIASLTWGLGEGIDWISDIVDFGVMPTSFDHFFLSGETNFWRHLERLKNMKGGLYRLATKPSEGEESELHYGLKLFLVHYWAEKKGLKSLEKIEREIRTEHNLHGGRVDLYLPAEDLAIEVETLYGQGFLPLSAIDQKVRTYVLKNRQQLHFVLHNLTGLYYLSGLKGIKKNLPDASLDFFTVDVKGERLLSLNEIESQIKQLIIQNGQYLEI